MSRRGCWDARRDPGALRALQGWSCRSASDAALGLALAGSGSDDIGTAALLWRFGLDDHAATVIVPRLAALVLLESERARIPVGDDQAAGIVELAMRRFRDEDCGSVATAAKRAGMRRASFEHLLARVQGALWGSLPGSLERFFATFAQDAA